MVDNGVPLLDFEGDIDEFEEPTEAEWEAFEEQFEAAAEACDPILEELSAKTHSSSRATSMARSTSSRNCRPRTKRCSNGTTNA